MKEIYQPAEDSFLLSKVILENSDNKVKKALDMGSGSGIQAKSIIDSGIEPDNITLVDLNKKAINSLKKKFPRSKIIQSDLFTKIKGKFDLITFNPPYLPEDKFDKKIDTTGGKTGSEIINEFLEQAKSHLSKNGKIYLLTSNFTEKINWSGYSKKLMAEKRIFFEKLYVWELKIRY